MKKKVFIIAGEKSGDIHGANLIKNILKLRRDVEVYGMGGEELRKAGAQILFDMKEVSVVGITEVLLKLPKIYTIFRKLVEKIGELKPEVVIVIDFPDFNFKVIEEVKKMGLKVIYYITPQVWAWRKGRVKFLKKYCDLLINILPFEENFFKDFGINSVYVGHPILDIDVKVEDKEKFFKDLNIENKEYIVVSFLPGSRNTELKKHLPIIYDTIEMLNFNNKNLKFLVSISEGVEDKLFKKNLKNLFSLKNKYYEILNHSDIICSASGTASLESALMGKPTIIFYKLNPLTYMIGKKLVNLPFYSLPNIILNSRCYDELIQKDFNPLNLKTAIEKKILNLDREKKLSKELSEKLRSILKEKGASLRTAQIIVEKFL